MLISAMLNIRLWTKTQEIDYIANGGWFSWPLIWLLEKGLKNPSGSYIIAIKWIVGLFLIGAIVYLLYVLNIRLPKLPTLRIEQPDKPKKEEKKSDANDQSRPVITITRPEISTESLMEKVSQATGISVEKNKGNQASGSVFKDLFKAKVEAKIEEKKPKPVIQYSGDKPTFAYSTLESNLGKENRINEEFLVQKARDLQIKLAEF